jgi:hypothetical protein
VREKVRLKARYPAAGAHERHHLTDYALRLRHVDKDESHMAAVERRPRQSRVVRIAFADLDLR